MFDKKHGWVRPTDEQLDLLTDVVRVSLLHVIARRPTPKSEMLKRLDGALFEASEIGSIRREVKAFWDLAHDTEDIDPLLQ